MWCWGWSEEERSFDITNITGEKSQCVQFHFLNTPGNARIQKCYPSYSPHRKGKQQSHDWQNTLIVLLCNEWCLVKCPIKSVPYFWHLFFENKYVITREEVSEKLLSQLGRRSPRSRRKVFSVFSVSFTRYWHTCCRQPLNRQNESLK